MDRQVDFSLVDEAVQLLVADSGPNRSTSAPTPGSSTEVWFSPPVRMPLGISVGAVTTAGRLHLVFRHRHTQSSGDAASRFADRYMAELESLSPRPAARHPGSAGRAAT